MKPLLLINRCKCVLWLCLYCTASFCVTARPVVAKLTCEYLYNPLGVEVLNPLLSWQVTDVGFNKSQSAYQVLVASSKENLDKDIADLWNSGKQYSKQSVHIPYQGKPLHSRQSCYWKVRVWDENNIAGSFSATQFWEMGLLDPADWRASWISRFDNNDSVRPAPLFRKQLFIQNKPVRKARAYVSGLGYYLFYINGKKVGDHELDPAVTNYSKRVKYVTYDIGSLLQKGKNVMAGMLGNGWYNQHIRSAWNFDRAPWRNAPTFLCQVEIEYVDGSKQIITSDNSWKSASGPIVFDGIRNGEHYDARLEMPGWNTASFDDREWTKAEVVQGPTGKLSAQLMPPIRITNTIKPVSVARPKAGVWLIDFGKGMAGRVKLKIKATTGARVTIQYGEKLHADGTLDQKELARFIRTGETQTEHYICNGNGQEVWVSHFVYHGFQYAQISGYNGELTKESIVAEELHTAFESNGSFSCSNILLNQLHQAALQSFVSNYHSYPEDCPHREKIGWTGDAQLVAGMGLFNFDMVRSYLKWLDDFTDEQQETGQLPGIIPSSGWGYTLGNNPATKDRGYGPQWEGAYVNIAWQLYLYTGDTAILRKYYAGLRKYIDYLGTHANNYTLNFGIDDHKSLTVPTDPAIISTGYFYQLTNILSKMAAIVGVPSDRQYYIVMASGIKDVYQQHFYDNTKNTYGNGGQTSIGLALYQGLTLEENYGHILNLLLDSLQAKNWHFNAGVLGVQAVTNALIEAEQSEVLYKVLTQTDYPSFGNWISKGATTLWQDWEGERSLNHIMFGSFTEFFYQSLAGIRINELSPGYRNFVLAPQFVHDLQWVKGNHHSQYGNITSEWKRVDNRISYLCSIPFNTTAIVKLPGTIQNVLVNHQKPVADVMKNSEDGKTILQLGSGNYTITWSIQ